MTLNVNCFKYFQTPCVIRHVQIHLWADFLCTPSLVLKNNWRSGYNLWLSIPSALSWNPDRGCVQQQGERRAVTLQLSVRLQKQQMPVQMWGPLLQSARHLLRPASQWNGIAQVLVSKLKSWFKAMRHAWTHSSERRVGRWGVGGEGLVGVGVRWGGGGWGGGRGR